MKTSSLVGSRGHNTSDILKHACAGVRFVLSRF